MQVDPYGPPTAEEIAHVEDVIGFPLPEPYRSWLAETGGGWVETLEMPGPHGEAVLQDLLGVVPLAENYRSGFAETVPANYLVVGDGAGGAVCLRIAGPGVGRVYWADYDLADTVCGDGESSEDIVSDLAPDWYAFLASR